MEAIGMPELPHYQPLVVKVLVGGLLAQALPFGNKEGGHRPTVRGKLP